MVVEEEKDHEMIDIEEDMKLVDMLDRHVVYLERETRGRGYQR